MKTLSRNLIKIILSYGIITGLLIIIVRAMVYLFDIDLTSNFYYNLINFVYNIVVLSSCLYLGTVAYRKKTSTGNLTYIKGLLPCIAISFVTLFLIFVYDIIFYSFINPEYLSNLLDPQIEAINNNLAIPSLQKTKMEETLQKLKSPYYSSSLNFLTSFGLSVIISLITAIFTVRNRPVVNDALN
jgi:hypothetical protein